MANADAAVRLTQPDFNPPRNRYNALPWAVGGGLTVAGLLSAPDAEAMPRARVPKLPQPKLPSTALDWAAEDARGAAREAARAKGIVPRGGADGGGAAAFDLFGDRAAPLVQAADDTLTFTPRGGAIPLRSPTGRLPPGGATRLEALGKISENPLLTRPGMPERAHAIDPTYLGKTLGGGAAIAGGATGLFGPSLVKALATASLENDALTTMDAETRSLYDALRAYRGVESPRGGTLKAPGDTVGSVTSNLLMGRPAYGAKKTVGQDISDSLARETDNRASEGGLLGAFRAFPTAILSDVFADPAAWTDAGGLVADPLRWAFSNRVGRGKGELERMRAQAR